MIFVFILYICFYFVKSSKYDRNSANIDIAILNIAPIAQIIFNLKIYSFKNILEIKNAVIVKYKQDCSTSRCNLVSKLYCEAAGIVEIK